MSKTIEEGSKAPDFDADRDGGGRIKLSSIKGRNVVLYFYPKDDTPGCTQESCEFSALYEKFTGKNTEIIGISKDSVASHDKFKRKFDLPFALVSDEDHAICEAYGTWVEKKNYGRTYMGIERATFLIDVEGRVRKIWRKVKVNGHVEAIINALTDLA